MAEKELNHLGLGATPDGSKVETATWKRKFSSNILALVSVIAETHLENLLVKSFKVTSMEQKRDQK